jgi:GNAT superfamily N-acetyltransferase
VAAGASAFTLKGEQGKHQMSTESASTTGCDAGTTHAALVFDGADCIGWCQLGEPEELPRIKSRAQYERAGAASPDWRIACCFVCKGYRRKGVATAALAGALDLIAGLGGEVWRATPRTPTRFPPGSSLGALSTYEQLGFVRDRKIGKHRWVVTKVVNRS